MKVLVCCLLVILFGLSAKAQLNPLCNSNDSVVLKSFMNVMDSAIDGWTTNSSNCCDWDGVTCNLDGKVVKLELSKKRLVGTLVESLSSLDQLKTLNISRNLFKGKVPSLLFHLKYLEVLDLSSNEFSEGFPDSVDLPRIEVLDVSDNNFEGLFAPGLCVNSSGVRVLKLGVNYFSGEIPPEFEKCG
ncbi:phytosulfokine receptor 1-like protein, partial [Tanacetum coccineum]